MMSPRSLGSSSVDRPWNVPGEPNRRRSRVVRVPLQRPAGIRRRWRHHRHLDPHRRPDDLHRHGRLRHPPRDDPGRRTQRREGHRRRSSSCSTSRPGTTSRTSALRPCPWQCCATTPHARDGPDPQEVTDGLAATAHDIAEPGEDEHTVLVIGHPTGPGSRLPSVTVARMDMRGGVPTLLGSADRGFVGAPAFVAFPNPASSEPNALLAKCLGLVLPGDDTHPVASFDKIRRLLPQITTDELPPGVYPHR